MGLVPAVRRPGLTGVWLVLGLALMLGPAESAGADPFTEGPALTAIGESGTGGFGRSIAISATARRQSSAHPSTKAAREPSSSSPAAARTGSRTARS